MLGAVRLVGSAIAVAELVHGIVTRDVARIGAGVGLLVFWALTFTLRGGGR